MSSELNDRIEQANQEAQRALNEAKKLELQEKYGMETSYRHPELDPAVESDFLDYVTEFEKQWQSAERTSVWEFVGKPPLVDSERLTDAEIPLETDRIMTILQDHNISINWPDEVTDREYYECLIGPLMQAEMYSIKIPGMMHGFIFEEFYPDRFPD
jgi:hypothetical protein